MKFQDPPPVTVNASKSVESEGQIEAAALIEGTTATTTCSATTSDGGWGSQVSMFDYSVENHFRVMDMIYKLCGQDNGGFDDGEIERLASTITFLSEWRYFNYNPRIIRFASEAGSANGTEAHNEINLSQFSAATVPKCDMEAERVPEVMVSTDSRKDFVLYVGGLVWALDWCPRTDQGPNNDAKCEFIAVAAHPPDSTYHKLGAPLSGRGMIQIWCLLNCTSTEEEMQAPMGSTKRKYQKNKVAEKGDNKLGRPRGRPRKNAIERTPAADAEGQLSQAFVVQLPENKSVRPRGRPRKNAIEKTPAANAEDQFTQALVVHLPENTSELPLADENIPSTSTSQNISTPVGRTKHKPQNNAVTKEENKQKKLRGKTRKNAIDKTPIEDPEGQFIPALAVRLPENTLNVLPVDDNILSDPAPQKGKRRKRKAVTNENTTADSTGIPISEGPSFQALAIEFPESVSKISSGEDNLLDTHGPFEEMGKKKRKVLTKRVPVTDLDYTLAALRRRSRNKSKVCDDLGQDCSGLPTQNEGEGPSLASLKENCLGKDNIVSGDVHDNLSDLSSGGCHFQKAVVLPRVVLCLGHDGKVAWDVKWRPPNTNESVNKHRMGYLAVVLGDGSLEVWEIPSPQVMNCVYASRYKKGTDPRFAKLKPVFRCSMLKYGHRQSMPLTVEWSASPPHNLILAGCHDGVVALWKFSIDGACEDARPLLCFSAETGPIRSLTWAPFQGDPESSNVIVTAGHGGLRFWDLRDPFRPLWDANPSQHFIYGLDWAPDPRCVIVSYDDGTLRMLSLSRAAYDVPVTGEPFGGTQQQGLHSYYCSSFAIWSIHVSRLTGMVAYCCADGTVLYFQLTHKAVDKDPMRNRAPHFLCGSLTCEESAVTLNTELPSSPHRMKKSATEWTNTPRSARTVVSGLNQGKRASKGMEKSQKPDDQVLALCYDDDTGNGGDPNDVQSTTKGGKGKTSKSKKANNDQALICTNIDEGNTNTTGKTNVKEEATGGETEVPPPKIAAMYRVRWNMNKGSERWLCYGGAAGIVRCQEIIAPEFDKKLLRR